MRIVEELRDLDSGNILGPYLPNNWTGGNGPSIYESVATHELDGLGRLVNKLVLGHWECPPPQSRPPKTSPHKEARKHEAEGLSGAPASRPVLWARTWG